MKKLLSPEDTSDPVKLNDSIESAKKDALNQIELRKGEVHFTEETIKPGTALSNVADNQLITEFNETNKRLLIKINGEYYEIGTLTKVT